MSHKKENCDQRHQSHHTPSKLLMELLQSKMTKADQSNLGSGVTPLQIVDDITHSDNMTTIYFSLINFVASISDKSKGALQWHRVIATCPLPRTMTAVRVIDKFCFILLKWSLRGSCWMSNCKQGGRKGFFRNMLIRQQYHRQLSRSLLFVYFITSERHDFTTWQNSKITSKSN